MITAHNHSSFTVSDVDRSVAFYRDVIGFKVDTVFEAQGEAIQQITGFPDAHLKVAHLLLGDFRLTLEVKLVEDRGNSGIQFRSETLVNGAMKGYQADIGVGWWGKLYEEHGRGLIWKKPGDALVKKGEWNTYEILAVGGRVQTAINGALCVDLVDKSGAHRGVIGLQLHSGGPTEVRFRNLKLELAPTFVLKTVE